MTRNPWHTWELPLWGLQNPKTQVRFPYSCGPMLPSCGIVINRLCTIAKPTCIYICIIPHMLQVYCYVVLCIYISNSPTLHMQKGTCCWCLQQIFASQRPSTEARPPVHLLRFPLFAQSSENCKSQTTNVYAHITTHIYIYIYTYCYMLGIIIFRAEHEAPIQPESCEKPNHTIWRW